MSQDWIADRLIELGKSQADLARALDLPAPRIAEMITDKRRVKISELTKLARFLELSIESALSLLSDAQINKDEKDVAIDHQVKDRSPETLTHKKIFEINIYGGMGGGGIAAFHNYTDKNGNTLSADDVRSTWEMPAGYISELRVSAAKARIIEVQGDSMEPTLRTGDRVMINTSDQCPSPPGIFAVWDGFGVVVKRVEPIPNSDPPAIRLISDNHHHGVYERTLDEIKIIGRIVWFSRKI